MFKTGEMVDKLIAVMQADRVSIEEMLRVCDYLRFEVSRNKCREDREKDMQNAKNNKFVEISLVKQTTNFRNPEHEWGGSSGLDEDWEQMGR